MTSPTSSQRPDWQVPSVLIAQLKGGRVDFSVGFQGVQSQWRVWIMTVVVGT